MSELPMLLDDVRQCRECEQHLPCDPRPIVQANADARILIIGQAPGRRVHESGIPWDDASGNRLRDWTGITRAQFYDARIVALVPMGFCYPGTGDSGDLPPRKECAELWHDALLTQMKRVRLTMLIGKYAQNQRLPGAKGVALTSTVQCWRAHAPSIFPLPHPSPRNNRWLKKNAWLSSELLPHLQREIQSVLYTA